METPSARSGVLIVRVWVEDGGGPDGLRARILQTVDGEERHPSAACRPADVLLAVRAWLDELLEQDG